MMASTTVAKSMGDVAVCVGDDDSSIKRRWGTMAMATHPSTGDDEGMATRMAASTGYDGDGNTPVVDGGIDGRRPRERNNEIYVPY